MSLVFGEDHVRYLGKRFEAFENQKLFVSISPVCDIGVGVSFVDSLEDAGVAGACFGRLSSCCRRGG
ncbi:malate:quinone oxidoreductase, partial [Rothia nasimurium]|uniref:malate:quinone oxidoreductase n=1 Tax=Rothia nasimurium TaxID=85336 RepID=UPI001F22A250